MSLVRSFEEATVSRDDWKHAEHLIVALYYVSHYDIVTATIKMRAGIQNLLAKGFSPDLLKEMPYHETITVFWIRIVAEFYASKNGASIAEKAAELVVLFGRDYPLNFYTRELLFSDEARTRLCEPDIKLFD